jgi:hypothetical protein
MTPDGEELSGGAYVSKEWWSDYGVSISASGGYRDVPRLFDTSDIGERPNTDPNLGSPNESCSPSGPGVGDGGKVGKPGENCVPQGNVLIIQESNTEQPDDNERGGMITFDFASMVDTMYAIGLMDIDEEGTTIMVTYEDESGMEQTKTIDVPVYGGNSVQTVRIDLDNVSQLKANLSGSGAVTYLAICVGDGTVPPSALPTTFPTASPTASPTGSATASLTGAPMSKPTSAPVSPTSSPMGSPTSSPTARPSVVAMPSKSPTLLPEPTPAPTPLCTNVTIDFSTNAKGDKLPGGLYVEDEWEDYGLTLSAMGGFGTLPRLFNTSSVGNSLYGDPDLGAPNFRCDVPGPGMGTGGEPGQPGENCSPQGNVLIIQEKNTDTTIPDDNVDGGMIMFEFSPPATYVYEMGFLDVDYETTITIVHDETEVTTIAVPIMGDNSYQVMEINIANVDMIKVTARNSAAVTHISLCVGNPITTAPPAVTPPPSVFPTPAMSMSLSMSLSLSLSLSMSMSMP